jgi:sugar lactone lactonase YvrE
MKTWKNGICAMTASGLLMLGVGVAVGVGGCAGKRRAAVERVEPARASEVKTDRRLARRPRMVEVFRSEGLQVTGVGVSRTGRVFVNFPRWSGPYAMALGEVKPDGTLKPWPTPAWNAFSPDPSVPATGPEATPEGDRFVCVQSVTVDDQDRVWVLDPASPRFAGVVRHSGGPKLVSFELKAGERPEASAKVYHFDELVAPDNSYLNDVRVDTRRQVAYVTDSGRGGLVVLDLKTGNARRVLDGHPSVMADAGVVPVVEGRELRFFESGVPAQIHSDGIALSPDGEWVYYQALTGRRLHRVPTGVLRDASSTREAVEASVEDLGETVVTDGMEMDDAGNVYFSALEKDAVWVRRPDGTVEQLIADKRLAWPDSFAIGPAPGGDLTALKREDRGDWLYVTTAQIHRSAWFRGQAAGTTMREPYRVFRVQLPAPSPARGK